VKNSKEQISSYILTFTIACFIQCSTLLVGFVSDITSQDTWFCVIIAFIVSLPIIWIFTTLAEKFPGKNIIEINNIVLGNVFGKIFSLFYIFLFLQLTAVNTRIASTFVVGSIMPETPQLAIIIMFVFVCGYAARKGLETMTRYSVIFVIIVMIMLIFNSSLLIREMHFSNFLPFLTYPVKNYIQSTHIITILPFSDIFVFFMLFSNIKNPQKLKKSVFWGLIIGAITLLFITTRDIAVLGPMIDIFANPSFEAVRLINISNFLTRMEIFYAIIWLFLLFFKISILFYVTTKAIAQIFNLSSYKQLVPIVGVIISCYALFIFKSSMESSYDVANISPFFQTFIQIILPLITLIVASSRGFKKPKEEIAQ